MEEGRRLLLENTCTRLDDISQSRWAHISKMRPTYSWKHLGSHRTYPLMASRLISSCGDPVADQLCMGHLTPH
jgi:hypothetical protein